MWREKREKEAIKDKVAEVAVEKIPVELKVEEISRNGVIKIAFN